jgi:hypothetical protein
MDADLEKLLTIIVKKQDKILAQQTKILKALHLLPVTEKEERAMQIQQRESAGMALKVAQDLADMAGEKPAAPNSLSEIISAEDPYAGIIGDDV